MLDLDYKILTKVLAIRLKDIMDKLLNPLESIGVKGRNILNNILNLETPIEYVEQNNLNAAFVSLDNEKAFDRLEQNYIIKVLERYNFLSEFLLWIKILYTKVTAKILVNGAFTDKINISRFMRQGCPLSMLLYVLSLEPLLQKLENNHKIVGLKIPNCVNEIKTFAHADDMTAIVKNDSLYSELRKETTKFSTISGSKINEEKTEVFVRGKLTVIPKKIIKKSIKVLGCYFGDNANNLNYRIKLEKMEAKVDKWNFLKLNIYERILFLKTYVTSIVQYQIKVFTIPGRYLRKMNMLMYKYIWNSRWEKIARKILIRPCERGGLGMLDLQTIRKADIITQIINIPMNLDKPWACLYVYWFGLVMKKIHPSLASNIWVHTLNIPRSLQDIKTVIKENQNTNIWNINNKLIYQYLIQKQNYMSKIERNYPQINWDIIWQTIASYKNSDMKSVLYKYILGVLPTGEYLLKFKIVKKVPYCCMCNDGTFTIKHIFQECNDFVDARVYLQQDIQDSGSNQILNETMYKFGNQTIGNNAIDRKVCNLILNHIYHILHNIRKPYI